MKESSFTNKDYDIILASLTCTVFILSIAILLLKKLYLPEIPDSIIKTLFATSSVSLAIVVIRRMIAQKLTELNSEKEFPKGNTDITFVHFVKPYLKELVCTDFDTIFKLELNPRTRKFIKATKKEYDAVGLIETYQVSTEREFKDIFRCVANYIYHTGEIRISDQVSDEQNRELSSKNMPGYYFTTIINYADFQSETQYSVFYFKEHGIIILCSKLLNYESVR